MSEAKEYTRPEGEDDRDEEEDEVDESVSPLIASSTVLLI